MQNNGNLCGHFGANTQMFSVHGTPGIGKSDLISQTHQNAQQGFSCDAFSQAAKSIAYGTLSSSQQNFHERLTAQLQRDADDIRKTCAYVRDPSVPRVVEYKSGDDLMAVTRGLCMKK